MKPNRINRVVQLLTILQSQREYATSELAEMLGISRRTVFRDMKDIQDAGLPCRFDKRKSCYTLDSESLTLPFNLSKVEAFSLLLLLHKSRHHIQFPLTHAILTAALKIEGCLQPEIRRFCSSALHNISVRPSPQIAMELLDVIFTRLLEGIQKKQVLNLHCYMPSEQRTVITDFSPYHLFYTEHTWHTIGESSFHKTVHTFKLNQIRQLNPLDKYFVEDEKFELCEYFGRAWSLLREGRLYNVELKFSPRVAANVTEVQWHKTQAVSFKSDGSAILKFRVDGLNEITWWVLSYGDQVEVLRPQALRQRIVDIARRMSKANGAISPCIPK